MPRANRRAAAPAAGDPPAAPAPAVSDTVKSPPAADRVEVEYRPVASLIPYARNARTHDARQLSQIAASMRQWGWTNPVLIEPSGDIIAGHGRVMAAEREWQAGRSIRRCPDGQVPCIVLAGLSPAEKAALVLADNKIALNAGWDDDLLRAELQAIDASGLDAVLTGFDGAELAELLAQPGGGLTDPDETPAVEEVAVSRVGDVWRLGEHRIVCGDCTSAEVVRACLGEDRPHLMVTDPPYGVNYDPSWRKRAGIGSDGQATGKVLNDDRADWRDAWALFPGSVAYVWHAGLFSDTVAASLRSVRFNVRAQIVWVKQRHVLSRGDYHPQHEPCQPAGTLVWKVAKPGRWRETSVIEKVPIETLAVGDRVVSYSGTRATNGGARIMRRGCSVLGIGSRRYDGNMHAVHVGASCTRATAEHRFTARFDPCRSKAALLYLMRRGSRWRIGVCGLFNSRGFGLAVRVDQEAAEAAWVVSVHDDMRAARVAEQVASCLYGIPTTHWETGRVDGGVQRDQRDIDTIYESIGDDRIDRGARALLAERGLRLEFPFIVAGEVGRFSRKQPRLVRACNLMPGLMQLPVPTDGERFLWRTIDRVTVERVEGVEVWSLDVERDQHYVADGIVTHNCLYAVREGEDDDGWRFIPEHEVAAYAVREGRRGEWRGGRKQSTVWFIEHVKSDTGHGTQKPVEAMKRPIENNSAPGDLVYEPFSGSGTSLIAAEMTGRRCRAVELNPLYVDVAVRRWEAFTGRRASLERQADGKPVGKKATFEEVAARRAREASDGS